MTEWLLTFLIHSSLWCGLAWLYCRFASPAARSREILWWAAIVASFMTPTVQFVASTDASLWSVHLPVQVAAGEEQHEESLGAGEASSTTELGPWQEPARWVWLAVASVLAACYLGRQEAFRRMLLHRRPVDESRALDSLAKLSRAAGLSSPPRLTLSGTLGSPVAMGLLARREICVPARAMAELDADEFSALLGHEVAHHMRRDAIRDVLLKSVQAVFFFQPLLRLAGREVQRAAEEQCDDWAASQITDRHAMASCLTEVATWVCRQDRRIPVPCMARHRSQLEIRVLRLMKDGTAAEGRAEGRAEGKHWRRHLVMAVLLAISPLLAPGVSLGEESGHESSGTRQEHGEHRQRSSEKHRSDKQPSAEHRSEEGRSAVGHSEGRGEHRSDEHRRDQSRGEHE